MISFQTCLGLFLWTHKWSWISFMIFLNVIHLFQEFFENPAFRPDGLKIYPTLVIRGTGLYELWKTGRYKSYPPNTLVDLIATILSLVPPWVRVYRVQRDIPMPLVRWVSFSVVSNLIIRKKSSNCSCSSKGDAEREKWKEMPISIQESSYSVKLFPGTYESFLWEHIICSAQFLHHNYMKVTANAKAPR